MAAGGVQKVLQKLRSNIEAGSFYEAHEMFKTVYHRYRARKQLEDSYRLAEEGAKLQLEKGQLNCGVELAMLLVEAYESDSVAPSEAAVQRVTSVMGAFPRDPPSEGYDPPVDEISKLAAAAVKWLRRGAGEQYVPVIELQLAQYIQGVLGWQGLGSALPHFAQADTMAPLAAALADAASHGLPPEEDLFIARCTLATAAAGPTSQAARQLAAAEDLLGAYEGAAGRGLPDTPLVHFLTLFLEALRHESSQLVQLLMQQYQASIDRDPALWGLVMKARALHAPPPAAAGGMGGLLGDLFKSMLAPPAGQAS